MTKVKIPYSREFIPLDIPDKNIEGILESTAHHFKPDEDQESLVKNALENPIDSLLLRELAKGKEKIVLITSDHTRPVPSKITLPILLEEIRKGNPQADITILIATGFHRSTTREEMIDKFGKEIVDHEKIINHDCRDQQQLIKVGILPSGGELWLNKLAMEADLLLSEGFIEPHFFAGFSGGRKSVLPGIAGETTVLSNHCSKFISSKHSRTGSLKENPIHRDMMFAAKKAKLSFILNVVIDNQKKIIHAVAGDSLGAHQAGCQFVEDLASVKAKPADIVITSNGGYPLDQNIYQAVKGMTAAEASSKKDSLIIIAAACNDGHGGQGFYETFRNASGPQEVMEEILKTPMEKTKPDQWESQILARILMEHEVILVSDQCDPQIIKDMHMSYAKSLEEALDIARRQKGKDAKITLIPDGVSVIVKK